MSDENDAKILNDVQDRFEVNVAELPEEIDISSYSKLFLRKWLSLNVITGVLNQNVNDEIHSIKT